MIVISPQNLQRPTWEPNLLMVVKHIQRIQRDCRLLDTMAPPVVCMQENIILPQTGWDQEQSKYRQLPISHSLPSPLISIICRRFHLWFPIFAMTDMMFVLL